MQSYRLITAYNVVMDSFDSDVRNLSLFLESHPRTVVLTGAGVSANSGIPTYRDNKGSWLPDKPIDHQSFLSDERIRRRYWARSWHGWPVIRDAIPNTAHIALAKLERLRHIDLLITQNVDRLHQRAGSRKVIDLHGRLDRVQCLKCERFHSRDAIQQQLDSNNHREHHTAHRPRPDGDMDTADQVQGDLVLPCCPACGGDLMPDVVFFGGNVPKTRVAECMHALDNADALVAVGSSLMVYSGFRFCRRASQRGIPLLIINPGVTRADSLARIKLSAEAGPLLESALNRMS
jgi:NAD-dependent SIR2 family protein deacetylase